MKILVDENVDETFVEFMSRYDIFHVRDVGWQGIQNGQLLAKAQAAGFTIFITADKHIPHQQSMRGRTLSLFVLDIHPNILVHQVACIPMIEAELDAAQPGQIFLIQGPHPKRR